ncbi:hypothetical protein ACX93W_23755 [Paenibacillus sp. CAU 1782]
MKTRWIKAGAAVLTASAIMLHTDIPFSTVQTVQAASASFINQSVKLNSSTVLTLENAQFLMQENGRVLSYTVLITNNGNSELMLNDYWVRVKTASGKSFSTKISEIDKNVRSVAPKTSKYLTYYSYVDNSTKLSDLKFNVIAFDFSVAGYERNLGTIQYSKNASESTAVGKASTMLYNNVKLSSSISNYSLTQDQSNVYLHLNYKLENQGFNAADLTNFNLFIQSKDQAVYPVVVSELAGQSLQPKQQKNISLHITLPKSLIGQTLNLIPAVKEASSNVMLPLGSFSIPVVKDSTQTEIGKVKSVYFEGEKVNTFLDSALVERNASNNTVTLQYAIRNVGKLSVNYPNFSFALITDTGISYPLTYKKSEETLNKLAPQMREVVEITGTIPSTLDLSKAKLMVKSGIADKNDGYVLGSYKIQTSQQSGTLASSYKYGEFNVAVNGIFRTATSTNDLLVADINIQNNGSTSKAVPQLSGYFMINGVKVNDTLAKVNLDNNVAIAPKGTHNVAVAANIPYDSKIDNITFVLTEKNGESEKVLYRYAGKQVNSIPELTTNALYSISNSGRKADAQITKMAVYEGKLDNYFYTELAVTNKEVRASQLAEYSGYLKDENGQIIPLTFAKLTPKIDPNGKVLISAWAKTRKNVDLNTFEMVLGQTATISQGSTPEQSSSIVIKPVKYNLGNLEVSNSQKSLLNVPFAGYNFSMKRVNALLNVTGMYTVTGLKLTFDYDLVKNTNYDYIAGDHKLLIEFVDQSSGTPTYSKQFTFGTPENGETKIEEALNRSQEIIFEDAAIQMKVQNYDNYIINIYDVFQDAKILVASKELKWFTTE